MATDNVTTNAEHQNPRTVRLVSAALILREDEVLICQRAAGHAMEFKWEFPGGKIEAGETAEQALVRELEEELGIRAAVGPPITRIVHNYRNGGAVDLQFFAVYQFEGELVNRIFNDFRWVPLKSLTSYDFLAADRGLIHDLAEGRLDIPR